jgi:hypothetical protein
MFTAIPRPALWLGIAGLLPLFATAAAVWLLPADQAGLVLDIQLYYAAIVLSFLGAVHWGLAIAGFGTELRGTEIRGPEIRSPEIRAGESPGAETIGWVRLTWSVVPALVGWVALLMTAVPALVTLMIAFAAVFGADLAAARRGLAPAWYPVLRRPLTVLVVLSLGASLMRVLSSGG